MEGKKKSFIQNFLNAATVFSPMFLPVYFFASFCFKMYSRRDFFSLPLLITEPELQRAGQFIDIVLLADHRVFVKFSFETTKTKISPYFRFSFSFLLFFQPKVQ